MPSEAVNNVRVAGNKMPTPIAIVTSTRLSVGASENVPDFAVVSWLL